MVLRLSRPLFLFILFVWISIIQSSFIRERKSLKNDYDFDLYDDPVADRVYDRMSTLCGRLRKRNSITPLVMRLCDLLA
ncbi:unnamed protein product [Auanema sp. JU1783]|nr:unnamed protein product [Auanema sp. JU1783]